MRKLITRYVSLIVFILAFSLNASAQDKAADGAKAVTTNMREQLSLNDGQYKQVHAVNLDFLQKALENNNSGKTKVDKAKRLKALLDDRDTKLKSVLSDEQYKKYVAMKGANHKKLKEHFQDN